MTKNTKYIPCRGNDNFNFIKVEVGYELGEWNYFSGIYNRRGYYIYVTPTKREKKGSGFIESIELLGSGSGKKQLLKEVKRKSAKAETEAYVIAEQVEKEFVDYVCRAAGVVSDDVLRYDS